MLIVTSSKINLLHPWLYVMYGIFVFAYYAAKLSEYSKLFSVVPLLLLK